MERFLCKQYGCLPQAGSLEDQDVGRLMRGIESERIYNAAKKPHTKWTPSEHEIMWPILELDNERQKRGE
jgi:hypothetical protein